MKTIINKNNHDRLKISRSISQICCTLFIFLSTSIYAQEVNLEQKQEQKSTNNFFNGFYLSSSIGFQNIFGGAFINDLDLLTQKSGFVLELASGYRKQFLKNRLLIGLEVQLGFTDGDLVGFDSRFQFDVFYKNKTQSGYGLITGITVGSNKNFLVYSYANVTNRSFDIEFTESNGTVHNQEDGQGFLRYGVGMETHLKKEFNIRVSLGGVYTDFGDLTTSQDVEDKLDINLGLVYQF